MSVIPEQMRDLLDANVAMPVFRVIIGEKGKKEEELLTETIQNAQLHGS